jgi:hypothetical protein
MKNFLHTNGTAFHSKWRVHEKMDVLIKAPQQSLITLYLDFKNWNKLFPATIQDARLITEKNKTQIVEVLHKTAGKVINILTPSSPNEIELKEFKPIYNAIFINRFKAVENGTLYIIEAYIFLKGSLKILTPFIHWLVRKRIKNYVLLPMKAFAENKTASSH